MKKLSYRILTCFFSFLFLSVSVYAQKNQMLPATPKAFQIFFAKFKSAVARGDKNAVVAITQFPFKYGFDTGDEGSFSRSQFIKHYDQIFGGEKKFLAKANPVFTIISGSYNLSNPENAAGFVFEKKGASYKFTGFFVEP